VAGSTRALATATHGKTGGKSGMVDVAWQQQRHGEIARRKRVQTTECSHSYLLSSIGKIVQTYVLYYFEHDMMWPLIILL